MNLSSIGSHFFMKFGKNWPMWDRGIDAVFLLFNRRGNKCRAGCPSSNYKTNGYGYEELAFHLLDSVCYRGFCRIGIADKAFQKSALCNNIKAISSETWEAINRILVAYGQDKGIEKGKEIRIDCTVVSSNIHEPTDSTLLWDSVRVLTLMLGHQWTIWWDRYIIQWSYQKGQTKDVKGHERQK